MVPMEGIPRSIGGGDLSHPVSVVTGASTGLGKAVCDLLVDRGFRVYAAARDVASLAHDARVHPVVLDVTSSRSVRAARDAVEEATSGVHLLVNCAGVSAKTLFPTGAPSAPPEGPVSDTMTADDITRMFLVNAAGPLDVCREFAHLVAATHGTIANVSSDRASLEMKQTGGNFGYCMSKAALNMATRALAADLRGAGVRVLAIHPGWFRSRIGGDAAPATAEHAAEQVLAIVDDLGIPTGSFVGPAGERIPW